MGEEASVANLQQGIRAYPVPAHIRLFIELGETAAMYRIVNAQGQVVSALERSRDGLTAELDLTALPSGVYAIQSQGRTARFVKE